jgi:hypothetical protein
LRVCRSSFGSPPAIAAFTLSGIFITPSSASGSEDEEEEEAEEAEEEAEADSLTLGTAVAAAAADASPFIATAAAGPLTEANMVLIGVVNRLFIGV